MEDKFRLMLVDDEPWALLGLEEIIDWEAMGFTIVARCECGQEALEAAHKVRPDAVITDIRMPDMSGIELFGRLTDIYPGMAGAVVSAYADFEIAREAIKMAVLYYVLKPLKAAEVAEMAAMLKEKLEAQRAEAQKNESIQVDLESPVFPVSGREGRPCYLLITDQAQLLTPLEGSVSTLGRVHMDGYEGILMDSLPEQLPNGVGISRPASDFSNGKQLLREALASLKGGFWFAEKASSRQISSAGDIQLYLYEHLADDISLKKLAGEFYLTETYLCDMFKKYTGESIFDFLKHVRLYRAKMLIQTTPEEALTFKEIAALCGYQNYSYFGQQFKKATGSTPEAYRKAYQMRGMITSTHV